MAPPVSKKSVEPEPVQYHEKAAFQDGATAAVGSGAFGLLVSALQNSLGNHKEGGLGIFTRSGGTIALFTAVGGVFAFTESSLANARATQDPFNSAAGGCAAGFVVGARAGSVPMMFGTCLAFGTLLGTFEAAGKSLRGAAAHPSPLTEQQDRNVESAPGGWREERDRRRASFFKPKNESSDTASE